MPISPKQGVKAWDKQKRDIEKHGKTHTPLCPHIRVNVETHGRGINVCESAGENGRDGVRVNDCQGQSVVPTKQVGQIAVGREIGRRTRYLDPTAFESPLVAQPLFSQVSLITEEQNVGQLQPNRP
jgi:hypothetical protein